MIIHCSYKKLVKLSDLIPHPKNTNKHPQKQIELLAKIIKYQGIRHPIIVSNFSGRIVAGHARLEAAKLLGYKEFPVDYQDFTNEAQEYAFLESDNRVAELAEWDREKFELNIDELNLDLDFDHELFGVLNSDLSCASKPRPLGRGRMAFLRFQSAINMLYFLRGNIKIIQIQINHYARAKYNFFKVGRML